MYIRTVLFPLIVAASLGAGSALADDNCTCRGNGEDIPEGLTVCLKTASGMKLARCERVLNNTSWKILEGNCPTADLRFQSDWNRAAG